MNHHAKRVNIQQSFRAGAPERKEPVDFTFKKMLVAFPPVAHTIWVTVTPAKQEDVRHCFCACTGRGPHSLEAGAPLHLRAHREAQLDGMNEAAPGLVARLRWGIDSRVWDWDCARHDKRPAHAGATARSAHAACARAPSARAENMLEGQRPAPPAILPFCSMSTCVPRSGQSPVVSSPGRSGTRRGRELTWSLKLRLENALLCNMLQRPGHTYTLYLL